jgi:hypothetical protein
MRGTGFGVIGHQICHRKPFSNRFYLSLGEWQGGSKNDFKTFGGFLPKAKR